MRLDSVAGSPQQASSRIARFVRTASMIVISTIVAVISVTLIELSEILIFYVYAWLLALLGILIYYVVSSIDELFKVGWRDSLGYEHEPLSGIDALKREFCLSTGQKSSSGLNSVPVPQPMSRVMAKTVKFAVLSALFYLVAIVLIGFLATFGLLSDISTSLSLESANQFFSELAGQLSAVGLAGSLIPFQSLDPQGQIVTAILLIFPFPFVLMCLRFGIQLFDEVHLRTFKAISKLAGPTAGYYLWVSIFLSGYLLGAVLMI